MIVFFFCAWRGRGGEWATGGTYEGQIGQKKREERRIPRPLRRPYACALMARSRQQREPFVHVCLFVLPCSPRAASLSTILHASTALAPAVIGVAEGTLEKQFDRTYYDVRSVRRPYLVARMYACITSGATCLVAIFFFVERQMEERTEPITRRHVTRPRRRPNKASEDASQSQANCRGPPPN